MSANQDIEYTPEQIQVIIGSVLGDGGIYRGTSKGANARLSITQGAQQYEYLLYKASVLGDMLTKTGIRSQQGGFGTDCFVLQTRAFPLLTQFMNEIYIDGRKQIGDWIWKLSDLGLAIWYMDDGSGGNSFARYLSTHCFTYDEHLILQNFLMERFNTKTVIRIDRRTNQYFLDIEKPSTSNLFRTIEKFIVPCMKYKLPPKMVEDRTCDVCGKVFTPNTQTKLRCSKTCSREGAKRTRHPRIEKLCGICERPFEYHHLLQKYCDGCKNEAQRRNWQKDNRKRHAKNKKRDSSVCKKN